MTFDCATIGDTMSDDSRARFGAGAEAWADYNQQALGRIRSAVLCQSPRRGTAAGLVARRSGRRTAKLERGDFCARLFDLPGIAYTEEEGGGWLRD
jgi:hypothetical protein